jgi:hypothetical protein
LPHVPTVVPPARRAIATVPAPDDRELLRRLAETQREVQALRAEIAKLRDSTQGAHGELERKLRDADAARAQAEAALQRAAAEAQQPPARPTPEPPAVPAPNPTRIVQRNSTRSLTPETLSDEHVTEAMNRGVDALLALVHTTINSPARRSTDHQVGEVSLALYALLTVGKLNGDPRLHFSSPELKAPVFYVLESRPTHTYALALQASALSLLPKRPEFRKALTTARDGLLRGTTNGIYSYTNTRPSSSGDNSNTQYGQLGIWAAQDAGLEVPLWYWGKVDNYWRSTQSMSGSWGYSASLPTRSSSARVFDGQGTATMTAAGVASLFLAMDEIDRTVRFKPKPDPVLESGLQWLADNFERYNANLGRDLYLAYGLERVALSGGIKTLGKHDWYREGSVRILDAQQDDGSWRYSRGSNTVGTGYALLFLARGIAPVAVAKLQYNGPWNTRARDCARFVRWLDKQTERDLRWEILDASSNVDDWRNVPILVITGHGDPNFPPELLAALRKYVHNGGLIFSSADQANPEFSRAIRQKYAPALFDKNYEMLAVTDKHPAFNGNYQIPADKQLRLFALSNGIRDVWIHSEEDITSSWQAFTTSRSAHFEVPANLYFHATGRSKARPPLQPLTPLTPPPSTLTLTVARLDYAGNADPEPAAWKRFATDARLRFAGTVNVTPTRIDQLDVAKTPIAHMTGTARFQLTTLESQKLAEFLNKGGVLLADAAGGSDAFAESFKLVLMRLFPQADLQALPPDSPVYTGAFPGGAPLKSLERRLFAESKDINMRPMAILELKINGRPAVLFSQCDLTAGINGLRAWGIFGYNPETSTALTWNALLYLSTPPAAAPKADAR